MRLNKSIFGKVVLVATILVCAWPGMTLSETNTQPPVVKSAAPATSAQPLTPAVDPAIAAARAKSEADLARANADKARYDTNVASVTQWTTGLTAIATGILTVFALVVVAVASPRIFGAANNGPITLAFPLIGSISLAQRNAAQQQQLAAPPPATPGKIARSNTPTPEQLTAVARLSAVNKPTASEVASLVQAQSTKLRDTISEISGVIPVSDAYFRSFFRNLFLSQYKLLDGVVNSGPISAGDANAQFANARSAGLRALRFNDWIIYLIKYGMVEPIDLGNPSFQLVATPLAQDFIAWSRSTQHGEDQLRAANLWN